MIYLFMDIKMHVSLRENCGWNRNGEGATTLHLFSDLMQWSFKSHENDAKIIESKNVLILIDGFAQRVHRNNIVIA